VLKHPKETAPCTTPSLQVSQMAAHLGYILPYRLLTSHNIRYILILFPSRVNYKTTGGITMELQFATHLKKSNLSENTLTSYLWTINNYLSKYTDISKENLLTYKGYLLENFKPKTINLRIQAINKYLEFMKKGKLQLKFVKVQQKNFLENVISNADYLFLKNKLKKDNNIEWYFVVWYLAATGARVSELIQIKIEHIQAGYFDLYTKGGKVRRLYIPKKLKNETEKWLMEKNITSGYLFLNRFGQQITTRGISQQLKKYAKKYRLNTNVVYPHSFRHRFAKNFLEKFNDIALLADLMGHESIETTRIYLRRTASEQQAIVDKIITW
jgi:site-specific recombinase XerD